ncbi:MAG TPA: hypothetical protein P5246_01695 [Candidatus Omnitrophota bacterium]|nr:hypothetical protein [Candidatus Omnitrophota bacterium]HSA31076.1 hypothetical protein [Candidatus Omnitrophota bacterium]
MKKDLRMTMALVCLCVILCAALAWADQNIFGLDTNNAYDIYLSNEQNSGLSVIKDVMILEKRDILGEAFILVRSDSFASKLNEGLVRFSAIQAIIPSKRSFRVEGTNRY